MSRGLMILLLVSLAANVFFAGFVGGRVLGGPPHAKGERHGPPPAGMVMVRDLEALPPEARESFRATFRDRKPELRRSYHELRRLRDAFAQALAADAWDRARVEASLEDLRAVEDTHQTMLAHVIIDAFESLTPDQRKAVIDAQERRQEAWRERRKMRRNPGDRPPPGSPDPDDSDDVGPPAR